MILIEILIRGVSHANKTSDTSDTFFLEKSTSKSCTCSAPWLKNALSDIRGHSISNVFSIADIAYLKHVFNI